MFTLVTIPEDRFSHDMGHNELTLSSKKKLTFSMYMCDSTEMNFNKIS